jgi:hypothetical protein
MMPEYLNAVASAQEFLSRYFTGEDVAARFLTLFQEA